MTKSVDGLRNEIFGLKSDKFILSDANFLTPSYRIFGKLETVELVKNRACAFSIAAFGVGNIERMPGIYFISCCTRVLIQMRVVEIISGNKEISFGYFISGDYVYFGVKTPPYNYELAIQKLVLHDDLRGGEISNINVYDQEPEGWTEVAITKFATN